MTDAGARLEISVEGQRLVALARPRPMLAARWRRTVRPWGCLRPRWPRHRVVAVRAGEGGSLRQVPGTTRGQAGGAVAKVGGVECREVLDQIHGAVTAAKAETPVAALCPSGRLLVGRAPSSDA